MVLRKEEERKQMHNKTGGGVFNLIFKRGKSSMGSGSVSSDNRSISPTHSDDSRSVTPPAVQAPPIMALPKKDPPPDRPKPPQRKRRPAPKPPQIQVAEASNESRQKPPSVVSNETPSSDTANKKTSENGLTICHSRNSSDSSGYHEASILSDHCANASLPRNRPRSAFVGDVEPLQSTSNLSKMSAHSRSTTSLVTGRKKKAAPPPPPVAVSPASSVVAQSEKPSPLVASQSDISRNQEFPMVLETTENPYTNPAPIPKPRSKVPKAPPRLRPVSDIHMSTVRSNTSSNRSSCSESVIEQVEKDIEQKLGIKKDEEKEALNRLIVDHVIEETLQFSNNKCPDLLSQYDGVELRRHQHNYAKHEEHSKRSTSVESTALENRRLEFELNKPDSGSKYKSAPDILALNNDYTTEEILTSLEAVKPFIMNTDAPSLPNIGLISKKIEEPHNKNKLSPRSTMISLKKSAICNTSEQSPEEFKPPEIVGVIPKTPKEDSQIPSGKDSFGRKRYFRIGSSLEQKYDAETVSISSKRSTESKSSRNSVASALNGLDDEISDLDETMFSGSLSKGNTKRRSEVFNSLFGIHDYNPEVSKNSLSRDLSAASLHSCGGSIPGQEGAGLKKWMNSEDLNTISVSSFGVRNRWVVGDASDTESVTSSNLTPAQTPHDSIPPCPLETSTPVRTKQEEKSIESTDSGIAQDSQLDREKDAEEDFGFHTPPPPPILDDLNEDVSTAEINIIDVASAGEAAKITNAIANIKEQASLAKEPEKINETEIIISLAPPITAPPIIEELIKEETIEKQVEPEAELVDIDWQYQLPSPPKAFRDSSPINLTVNETHSVSDFKDSVVTSPELFERLKSLEDNQSEKETLKSEVTSVASEEPLNTLSLEHLEKRKSLVYNRELATSLKMTDNIETSGKSTDASSHTGFQTAYGKADNEVSSSKEHPKATRAASSYSHHTLPNFKITTYDVPKHQNIKVFEDDTIRSNTHGLPAPLRKNQFGHSMENISFAKNSSIAENKEQEYTFYKPKPTQTNSTSVSRSGSFSTDNKSLLKPVSRSKSTLTLNKYQAGKREETNISRSNSLFDVSGLQSLEVMRLIQNKLNTPVGSVENINARDQTQTQQYVPPRPVPKVDVKLEAPPRKLETTPIEEKSRTPPQSPELVKKYHYRGPPAVNMSTWSERPKVPVAVKEDEDYKLGNVNNITSKLIVNTTNNNISSNNSIEVRGNGVSKDKYSETRYVKTNTTAESVMNSTEQITHKPGNVVIKIGSTDRNSYIRTMDNQCIIGPTGYRKPFTNINRIDENNKTIQRPHSIALPSDFNISRVPVVRSVEFKKPFKDLNGSNTSITHLNHVNDEYSSLHEYYNKPDSFADRFRNNDNIRNVEKQESEPVKRIFRTGGFKPVETNAVPIVRGFKPSGNNSDINKRLSWNPPTTYSTLPAKPKVEKDYNINQHVPFSQSTLRRTESSRLYGADQNPNDIRNSVVKDDKSDESSYKSLPPSFIKSKFEVAPPPPPQMPKVVLRKVAPKEKSQSNSPTDARDMLLESIRNFGGKKGLKAVKA